MHPLAWLKLALNLVDTGLLWPVDPPAGRRHAQLVRNVEWVREAQNAPTVAEQFGLDLSPPAWMEFRSGNSDATD